MPGSAMERHHEGDIIRIVIADGDPMARRALSAALHHDDMAVVAEATTGGEVVELARFYHPAVVIVDDRLSLVDGFEATRRLQESSPDASVIVLTSEEDAQDGLQALRAGAAGYLSKGFDPEALPRIVRGVAYGEAAISRSLTMMLIDSYRRIPRGGAGLRPVRSSLTDREWEVLDLLAGGEGTEGIARALVLSTETVRSHLKNLYRKLGVRSRAEAVEAARRMRELVG